MAEDSKRDMVDTYEKLVESKRTTDKQIAKDKLAIETAELKAAQKEQNSTQAEKSHAAAFARQKNIDAKRDDKRTKAQGDFKAKHDTMKDSAMRGYDRFDTAMMEILAVSLAFSKSIHTDVGTSLIAPMSDKAYNTLLPVVGGLVGLPLNVVKGALGGAAGAAGWTAGRAGEKIDNLFGTDLTGTQTSKIDLPPELLVLLPQSMTTVTPEGKLTFEKFTDKHQGKGASPEVLEGLDDFYEHAIRIHLKNNGYEYDKSDGIYKANDGHGGTTPLQQDIFDNIVTEDANIEQVMSEAMKHKPDPDPEPEPSSLAPGR